MRDTHSQNLLDPNRNNILEQYGHVMRGTFIRTDNGTQFDSKFFTTVGLFLELKKLTTTAYCSQANELVEGCNYIMVARLHHYVSEHQKNWDTYIQSFAYAYNTRTHLAKGNSAFNIVGPKEPSSTATFGRPTGTASDMPKQARSLHPKQRLLERLQLVKEAVQKLMVATKKRYKNAYDKKVRQEPQIRVSDEVCIDRPKHAAFTFDSGKNFTQKTYKKGTRRTHGTYKVMEAKCHRVVISEDSIRNRVTPVQKYTKDTEQVINTGNKSKTQTKTTGELMTEYANKGNKEKEVKEYVVGRIFRHVQRLGRMPYVVGW